MCLEARLHQSKVHRTQIPPTEPDGEHLAPKRDRGREFALFLFCITLGVVGGCWLLWMKSKEWIKGRKK